MSIRSFLFSLMSISFISPAFAISSLQPAHCPTVQAIKSVGVHDAERQQQSTWIAFSVDNFSTPQQWKFAIVSDEEVKDKEDAIKKGNENISLLSLTSGPNSTGDKEWICDYEYDDGQKFVVGMAVTPPGNILFPFKHL